MRARVVIAPVVVVSQMPCREIGGTRNVRQLGIVERLSLVAGLVVVGLSICVIPDDGHAVTGKRPLVASAYGVVPGPVVGMQTQLIAAYIAP